VNCWACFKICTPALLAAHPTPTYSESISFERYACPLLSDRNPIRLCVPSQSSPIKMGIVDPQNRTASRSPAPGWEVFIAQVGDAMSCVRTDATDHPLRDAHFFIMSAIARSCSFARIPVAHRGALVRSARIRASSLRKPCQHCAAPMIHRTQFDSAVKRAATSELSKHRRRQFRYFRMQ
jgi:hypothetical protein